MRRYRSLLMLIVIFGALTAAVSCKKSNDNNPNNPANYKNEIAGNWADSLFIDATTPGSIDTLDLHLNYPDSIQFLANGSFVGTYYTEAFDYNLLRNVWLKNVDSTSFRFVTDSTVVFANLNYHLLSFGNDTFSIRGFSNNKLTLYSPNTTGAGGGSGGYYYVYTRY